MTFKKTRLILVFLIACSAHASGSKAGNGGGAFICPDPTQSEFFDLWEAENPQYAVYNDGVANPPALTIPRSSDPVEVQIQKAFDRLMPSPRLYKAVMDVYKEVRNATVIPVPAGVQLAWPTDEENKYIKKNCEAKAVILYHDYLFPSQIETMDEDIDSLNALTNTDQAAAWVHETIYKFLRKTEYSVDSILARQITSQLFSNQSDEIVEVNLKKIAGFNFAHLGVLSPALSKGRPAVSNVVSYPGQWDTLQYFVSFDAIDSDPGCKEPAAVLPVNQSLQGTFNATYDFPGSPFGGHYDSFDFSFEFLDHFMDQSSWSFFQGEQHLHCFAKVTIVNPDGGSSIDVILGANLCPTVPDLKCTPNEYVPAEWLYFLAK